MAKDHGPQIKDDALYEKLREQGAGKEKAARIANTGRKTAGQRGGQAGSYDTWSRDDLYRRARELDVPGRSRMTKRRLIETLRNR